MKKPKEETITSMPEPSVGDWAREARKTLNLTQLELAGMCGVSLFDVYLFEQNRPVKLDVKRKIFKKLWAARSTQCQTCPR